MSSRPPFWRNPDPPPSGSSYSDRPLGPMPLQRFKVILHRTADSGLMFIARTITELTRYGEAEAQCRMWEVYHGGKSLILVTHLERAELFVEQFADKGLIASLEPA